MDRVLLAAAGSLAASLLLPPAPATARDMAAGTSAPRFVSPDFHGGFGCGGFGDHRSDHHGRFRDGTFRCAVGGYVYDDGIWALTNNRSWQPDSYNDWWNDRPDRAFPRWVQQQRGGPCDPDRMWWSGTGWHC